MHVDFAFLCDVAQESGGKLHALGVGIDTLHARQVPARHPRIALVARISYRPEDAGAKAFAIRIVDADGRDVTSKIEGEIQLGPVSSGVARANLIIDLVNLEFTTYGPHEVSVHLAGQELVTLGLEVARPPQER